MCGTREQMRAMWCVWAASCSLSTVGSPCCILAVTISAWLSHWESCALICSAFRTGKFVCRPLTFPACCSQCDCCHSLLHYEAPAKVWNTLPIPKVWNTLPYRTLDLVFLKLINCFFYILAEGAEWAWILRAVRLFIFSCGSELCFLCICLQSQIKLILCYWFPKLVSLNFTESNNYLLVKVMSCRVLIAAGYWGWWIKATGRYLHTLLFCSHSSMWR